MKFIHPFTGELIRESLGTSDEAKAELLRQRVELEAALLAPRFQAADLPRNVRKVLESRALHSDLDGNGCNNGTADRESFPPRNISSVATSISTGNTPLVAPALIAQTSMPFAVMSTPLPRLRLDEALKAYIDSIREKNTPHHVAGKISMLRRFLGTQRTEQFVQEHTAKRCSLRLPTPIKPFFTGEFVDEITPLILQEFFQHLEVSTVTKRHYRELFHSFFDYSIKFGFYRPENFHCPNPVAALPSYHSKNHRIIYLTAQDVEAQLTVLEPYPDLYIGAAIMIYAGLRRAEALWLTRDAFSRDLSYISVTNRVDEDTDIESSLKTGERAVTIIPPLKRIIEKYLPALKSRWLIPMNDGSRWDGNAFARKLRKVNTNAGLSWSPMHYRHTFATQRAAEGWSLLRISMEMGNSVTIVTKYYAAYMRPVEIGVPAVAGAMETP